MKEIMELLKEWHEAGMGLSSVLWTQEDVYEVEKRMEEAEEALEDFYFKHKEDIVDCSLRKCLSVSQKKAILKNLFQVPIEILKIDKVIPYKFECDFRDEKERLVYNFELFLEINKILERKYGKFFINYDFLCSPKFTSTFLVSAITGQVKQDVTEELNETREQ